MRQLPEVMFDTVVVTTLATGSETMACRLPECQRGGSAGHSAISTSR